jgi:hypothetical protein
VRNGGEDGQQQSEHRDREVRVAVVRHAEVIANQDFENEPRKLNELDERGDDLA